jgi:hypothetical protein
MPIQVKPIERITAKYISRAQSAGADYKAGVMAPRRDYVQATVAAQAVWAAAVTQAAGDGRFARGVQNKGAAKWQRKSADVGAARYGQGVAAAGPDFQAGISPFLTVISQLNLPPRGPKGDPGNFERSREVGVALHQAKLRGV